jgi:hypothetical protein
MVLLGLGLFQELYGWNFLTSLFQNARVLSVTHLVHAVEEYIPALSPFLLLAFLAVVADLRNERRQLVFIYLLIAGTSGLFVLSGEGVVHNALFDLTIATFLCIGFLADRMLRELESTRISRAWIPTLVTIAVGVPMLPAVIGGLLETLWMIEKMPSERQIWNETIATIARNDGPAACESLELCYWAGKRFEIDFFNYGQALKTGRSNPDRLIELIDRKYFSIIQLHMVGGELSTENLPQIVIEHIKRNYVPIVHATRAVIVLVRRP